MIVYSRNFLEGKNFGDLLSKAVSEIKFMVEPLKEEDKHAFWNIIAEFIIFIKSFVIDVILIRLCNN